MTAIDELHGVNLTEIRERHYPGLDWRTYLPSSWDAEGRLQLGNVEISVQARDEDDPRSETFISLDDRSAHPWRCLGRLGEQDAVDLALYILANVPAHARRWSRA